jgi:hypothetical protein
MLLDAKQVSQCVLDPAADLKFAVLRAPSEHAITVERAYAVVSKTIAASTANYIGVSLINGGTAGTATTVISGTAFGTAGAVAYTPGAVTITDGSGKLTAGQYLMVNYDETGTVDPDAVQIIVEYVDGVGEKAEA